MRDNNDKFAVHRIYSMKTHSLLILFLLVHLSYPVFATEEEYTLLKIGYAQGLSNSAVLSIYQDNQGLMWFGTYDGLNHFDGKTMNVYRADLATGKNMLNNVINQINAADSNCLWISTNLGVNRFSVKGKEVVGTFEMSKDNFSLYSNRKGNTWVMDREDIYYYNTYLHNFIEVHKKDRIFNKKLSFVDERGYLWLFSSDDNSVYQCHIDNFNKENPVFSVMRANIHIKKIVQTFYQNGILSFIDKDNDLFLFDTTRNTKVFIRNIAGLLQTYGNINGITSFYDDIVIAFRENGLIKLDASSHYKENRIESDIRIFSMCKDAVQDIIWVGTDGQGVMACTKKQSLGTHLMYNQLQNKISRQVRSIYTDDKGDLWFGTKGDGLVRIKGYIDAVNKGSLLESAYVYFPGVKKRITDYDRGVMDSQIFSIIPSRYMNGFWMGGAENPGLSYYDYAKDQVFPVLGNTSLLQRVHQIYEENDTTLWMTTSGNGLCKVDISRKNDQIIADTIRQFVFHAEEREINDFFPMVQEGDSVLWLGSRGLGLVRFSMKTEDYEGYWLGDQEQLSINDILSIYRKDSVFYLGTVSGFIRLEYFHDGGANYHNLGKERGFLNDMIHGILEDENGYLWLSTNKGLVKYNSHNNTFHTYYYSNGLQIGEFSDDAYYKCPYTGNLFFGGIDGLLYLNKERVNEAEYHPDICFRNLTLGVERVNLYDYYNENSNILFLKGANVTFSISFIAPDFINGDNYEYSYQLLGNDDTSWSSFGFDNVATFKNLSYGNYVLNVRYKKNVFDTEYKSYSLNIHILPPWYLSWRAYIIYTLAVAIATFYIARLAKKYYRREKLIKELMEYEARNSSVVGIGDKWNETAGAFASIYRMCGQLYQYKSMPPEYYKMLDVIHDSVLSFAFKSGESWSDGLALGRYLPVEFPIYEDANLKDLSDEVIRMLIYRGYDDLSGLHIIISDDVFVRLPQNAIRYILYYFYTEALSLKINPPMTVNAQIMQNTLVLSLTIPEDLSEKFLEVLRGNMVSDKEEDFNICLYRELCHYALKSMQGEVEYKDRELEIRLVLKEKIAEPSPDQEKKNILLLENKNEITWLIKDILSENYNIDCVQTIQDAFTYLRKKTPDLFLADTQMYLGEESKFIEYVYNNKGLLVKTAFIPMLTWKAASLLQQEFNRLADGFVVMPYNILFIREIINLTLTRASDKKAVLVEFPSQPVRDIVCETTEQADFIKKLVHIIDVNLDREDLGSSFLADQMNMSSRQFYRKFKEISGNSPSDFIKNYRIDKAALLLEESDMSIADVINEVGIASRSYFYKEFLYKFGVTPKEYREKKGSITPK